MVVTRPPAVRMTMKPPPPTPHENGSVTPRTAADPTAASTAFPPRRRMPTAASVASFSTDAAAPPVPIAVGGPEPLPTSAAAGTPKTSAPTVTNAVSNPMERIGPPFSDDGPTLLPDGPGYKSGRPRTKTGTWLHFRNETWT